MAAQQPALFHRRMFWAFLILTLILLNGCSGKNNQHNTAQSFTVDPVFQEFYDRMGGKRVLGAVISPAFVIQNTQYQYTENAVLMKHLLAEGDQKVKLSPVGIDLNIDENLEFVEGQINGPFLRDFIYPEFFQVYQYLGGLQGVGKPLTGLHYNPKRQRYEQYFENLGFYRLEKDTPGTVNLLAYGAWKCGKKCPVEPNEEAKIDDLYRIDPIFTAKVDQLGKGFIGFPLTNGYQSEDGGYEQVFENVILRLDINQPNNITLAPLPQRLGIISDTLEIPNQDTGTVFIAIEGEKGYKIPKELFDYINTHGGFETIGYPISQYKLYKNSIYRQCFEYLCLEIDTSISGIFRIRPAPLGYSYLDLFKEDLKETSIPPTEVYFENVDTLSTSSNDLSKEISIQVWENYPFVTSDQAQSIGVMVYSHNQPMVNVMPELMIIMPDGSQKEYFFPATDQNGKSQIQLEPTGAPNGSLIPYQVCVSKTLQEKFCVQDNFLIWNNP